MLKNFCSFLRKNVKWVIDVGFLSFPLRKSFVSKMKPFEKETSEKIVIFSFIGNKIQTKLKTDYNLKQIVSVARKRNDEKVFMFLWNNCLYTRSFCSDTRKFGDNDDIFSDLAIKFAKMLRIWRILTIENAKMAHQEPQILF